jgi:predicted nucleic acid-binding protein
MTRFVVDARAVIHLASAGIEVPRAHKLLAPALLRSQTRSALHEAVQRGEIPADVARDHLARIGRMPVRLLGDGLLRRRASELADRLGWAPTYDAEYLALTLPAGGRVRDPGRGTRAQAGRYRRDGFHRRAELERQVGRTSAQPALTSIRQGRDGHGTRDRETEPRRRQTTETGPEGPALCWGHDGGRYWIRTSDLADVNRAL